ncbi:hypothetical protein BpHYR1_028010 [Brachionus plicatilis]|uniref:Uncharacterized protein n=1 Tax=Brachionus plicatilis TaxID=10195 RepID=A0A3M7RKR2_BRAPC|nr:hypothetical protein BpHYR1_028010 [Brachionus plicatilis]
MNAQTIRDYANRGIEANRLLLDSAEDLSNINQIAQANRNIVDFQNQQRLILERLNEFFDRFDELEQRFDTRLDQFNTRLDQISVVSARAVNANCIKPNFCIQWIVRHDEPLPHNAPTYGDFMRLSGDQIIDFLNYYEKPVRRTVKANRRALGCHLGIPFFVI